METLFRHNAANRSSTCASSRAAFSPSQPSFDVVRERQILRLLNGALEGEHVAGTEEDAVAKQGQRPQHFVVLSTGLTPVVGR